MLVFFSKLSHALKELLNLITHYSQFLRIIINHESKKRKFNFTSFSIEDFSISNY